MIDIFLYQIMAQKKKSILSTVIGLLVIAAIAWMKYQETDKGAGYNSNERDSSVVINQPEGDVSQSEIFDKLTTVSISSSKFEVLEGCTIKEHRGNDGDSFHVKTKKGDKELRLYYVDAPESEAREYRNGDTNYKRISQQGAAMGGLNQKQTTEVGMEAKMFVKKLLKGKKFRVATTWESVYNSHRSYAYILVPYQGEERYLQEN